MNCLAACKTLPWSARSPDFSPIEHAWDMMGRRLHLPGNVDDLVRKLEKIWQEISQEAIKVLYHSMPRQFCMKLEVGQHLIELFTLYLYNSEINHSIFLKF
ncbi:transposable element Tcb1 transposase [Trichonephila clavipes]|nr:transposable element Tcb1 transposase [Trichonephila clavipes]